MNGLAEHHYLLLRRNPFVFFLNLVVDGPEYSTVLWGKIMTQVQKDDFRALSPALAWMAGAADKPRPYKFWRQRSRGYSKTTELAAILCHALIFAPKKISIDVVADDKDQGKFILEQVDKLVQLNPWMGEYLAVQQNRLVGTQTKSVAMFMSRDNRSAFGRMPDMTICDELTHWRLEEMWHVTSSSAAKRDGVLIIACNAGYGKGWQWDVRELARTSEDWHFSCPEGPAPWVKEKTLEEQRALLPQEEYLRVWQNIWQSSSGAFLTLEEADACADASLTKMEEAPADGLIYVASIDYAEKNDRTVCCLGHLDKGHVIVDRMDVFDPREMPGGICRVDMVEDWITGIHRRFARHRGNVIYLLDPWGLQSLIQTLSSQYSIYPVDFRSGGFLHRMAYTTRHLILHQRVRWYPRCGEIILPSGEVYAPGGKREDLATELAELETKPMADGRWRIDHSRGKHDDRAVALGMLCLSIVEDTTETVEWGITPPDSQGQFRI